MLAELKRLELASIDETLQLVPQEAEHERGCGVPPIFGGNIPIYRINFDLEIARLHPPNQGIWRPEWKNISGPVERQGTAPTPLSCSRGTRTAKTSSNHQFGHA